MQKTVSAALALTAKSANGNVHNKAGKAGKAVAVFSTLPVEGELLRTMIIIAFILQLLATIAVIVFIIHTATVHKRMNDIFKRMNKTIDDISIHLNIIKETNDNLTEVHNKLNVCTNGITEIMSKQRRYRAIDDKNAANAIDTIKEYLVKIEAKNSFENLNSSKTSSFKKKIIQS